MTIIAMHCQADRALLATDSEYFSPDGTPAGDTCKLVTNGIAMIAMAAAGAACVARTAALEVLHADNLDLLLKALPPKLQKARATLSAVDHPGVSVVALTGFSPRLGRMIAATLEAPDFVPEMTSTFSQPWSDELVTLHPEGLCDLFGVCQAQLHALQSEYPAARGGVVVGALVTRDGIVCRQLGDLRLNLARQLRRLAA